MSETSHRIRLDDAATLSVENDSNSRELRSQLARVSEMDDDEVYRVRDDAANGYMLYAVKPLSVNATRTPLAMAIRAERTRLYRELWLATWEEGLRR